MKSLIRFFEIAFWIGTHGVAIAGVFFAVKAASGNNFGAAIAFGAMSGVIILGLIAWWSFMNAEPTRRHWLGNILYQGGYICAGLLAVAGVVFAGIYGRDNLYGGLVAPFVIVVFWIAAIACQIVGRGFLYFLAGR
jgi:hypothetical protein